MPRPLRPIAEGLIYHVINRGNAGRPVFFAEGDYLAFLRAMADLKERKAFDLFGYCRDAGVGRMRLLIRLVQRKPQGLL